MAGPVADERPGEVRETNSGVVVHQKVETIRVQAAEVVGQAEQARGGRRIAVETAGDRVAADRRTGRVARARRRDVVETGADDVVRKRRAQHVVDRSEEHTSELQSLLRHSYAVFCLKKKNITNTLKNII